MPVKSATGTSKLTVQPLPIETPQPALGSLPTSNTVRSEVPNVIAQGNSYFTSDSIGSAKFDSRMDFPKLPTNASILKLSKNKSGKKLALSPEKPCLIASIDIFSPPGTDKEKTYNSIQQSLEIAQFESSLIKADYEYVLDRFENDASTATTMKSLKDAATSKLSKVNDAVTSITRLSAASEEFSKSLDIRLFWDNVGQLISQHYSTFPLRFGDGSVDTKLSILGIDEAKDSGTAIIKKLEKLATSATSDAQQTTTSGLQQTKIINLFPVGYSAGYFAIDKRVEKNDLLFDDSSIANYSELGRCQKAAACCEFLSRVFIDTFTGLTGSAVISLPTQYSGSLIFEPSPVKIGTKTYESHYGGFISPSIENLSTAKINEVRASAVDSYNNSFSSAKIKMGIDNVSEKGTPLDIYTRMFSKIFDSYSSLYASAESSSLSNQAEIYDSVILLYSMKQQTSSKEFNGFMRGILLTMILDPDFEFNAPTSDEFDNISESESESSVDGATSTKTKTKTGNKTLKTKKLSDYPKVLTDSIFSNPERLKNFHSTAQSYTKIALNKMDYAATTWTVPLPLVRIASNFSPGTIDSAFNAELIVDSKIDGWSKNAPKMSELPSKIASSLPSGVNITTNNLSNTSSGNSTDISNSMENNDFIFEKIIEAIPKFSRDDTGKTIGNAILDLYDELLALFEDAYGKKFEDISPDLVFYTNSGKTCTKRAIVDVILECLGNLISHFLSPGFYVSPYGKSNTVETISKQYLSVNENYYESLKFCSELSKVSGDLTFAINNAYISSGLNNKPNSPVTPATTAVTKSNITLTNLSTSLMLSMNDDLYTRQRNTKTAIAALSAISSMIDTSCKNFISAIETASLELSSVPQDIKNDVMSSLTPEVASSIALKEDYETGIREPFEESLTIYDTFAANWFYTNYKKELSSDKVCLTVGLPSGFTTLLNKSEIELDTNFQIVKNTFQQYRDPAKFSLVLSARSIQRPFANVNPLLIGKFHPLLHAQISGNIVTDSSLLKLAASSEVKLLCYDRISGTWVETNYTDCVEFLVNGGNFGVSGLFEDIALVTTSDAEDVIKFHVLDAILKSTIRVSSGVDLSSTVFGGSQRTIDAKTAASVLSLFNSAAKDLVPRGSLTASDFLSIGELGNYIPVEFSSLSGEGPRLTNPSTHSLLLKILGSGVFTANTLLDRVIAPSPFERTYCVIYDPNDLTVTSTNGESYVENAIREVSLLSLNIVAE